MVGADGVWTTHAGSRDWIAQVVDSGAEIERHQVAVVFVAIESQAVGVQKKGKVELASS